MLAKCILIIQLIFFSFSVFSNCLITDAIKDPNLQNNPNFWNDLATLQSKGKSGDISDSDLKRLIEKYTTSNPKPPQTTSPSLTENSHPRNNNNPSPISFSNTYSLQPRAKKEIAKLQPNVKKKLDEFLDTIVGPNGFESIRQAPGSWNLHEVKKTHGPNAYTIRLDNNIRVLFDWDKTNHEILIREVNRDRIHNP